MRQEVIQKAPEQPKKQTPNLTGIPTQMKLDFERRSGLSFDDVRVHYNSDKPRRIGALAYTQIPQVHIGPGQERHLRHELGHVVQQKQGIVRPDTQHFSGLVMNTDARLEYEADLIGHSDMHFAQESNSTHSSNSVIQAAGYFTNEGKSMSHLATLKSSLDTDDWVAKISSKMAFPVVMIFESMGLDDKAYNNVHDQTLQCHMNTILVFGLNEKKSEGTDVSELQARLGRLDKTTNEKNGFYHFFFPFWFTWKTPLGMGGTEYEMPFVDARLKIMKVAQDIVDTICGSCVAARFMFRWFDGDATDASLLSSDDEEDMLRRIADCDEPIFVTGRYDWKSKKADGTYADFVSKLNEDEKNLRTKYFELLTKLFSDTQKTVTRVAAAEPAAAKPAAAKPAAAKPAAAKPAAAKPAAAKPAAAKPAAAKPAAAKPAAAKPAAAKPAAAKPAAAKPAAAKPAMPQKPICFNGSNQMDQMPHLKFYLPEPLFMMNEKAHSALLKLPKDDISNQSRESEKLFLKSLRLCPRVGLFPWIENFSVKKPIKEEFRLPSGEKTEEDTEVSAKPKSKSAVTSSGTSSTQAAPSQNRYSYWKNMLEFFLKKDTKEIKLTNFRDALAHLRQSAFGSDWMFYPMDSKWVKDTDIVVPTGESSIPQVKLAQIELDIERQILSANRWDYLNEPIEFVVQQEGRKSKTTGTRFQLISAEIREQIKKASAKK